MTATTITNVAVFDGENILGKKTIVIEDGLISKIVDNVNGGGTAPSDGAASVDGSGCTLLPGLIDSHAHLYDRIADLQDCAKNGVTTMLDMGNRDYTIVAKLRELPGVASVFSVMDVAFAPGSIMSKAMYYPPSCEIKDEADAVRFVNEQVQHGADFIKIILEDPAQNNGVKWPPEVAKSLVDAAHKAGKLVIAHAVTADSYLDALQFGVDEISHVPFSPLPQSIVNQIVAQGVTVVPTITMMAAIAKKLNETLGVPATADFCIKNLAEMRNAGVNLLVATDANLDDPPSMATTMAYGSSLHRELAYFVQAGFSPAEALRAATARPADFFGLNDRGRIAVGKRADLCLVKGDPSKDISDICKLARVWIAGVEVEL